MKYETYMCTQVPSGAVLIPREIFVRSLVSYCEEPQVYSLKLDLQSLAWKKKSFSLLAFLNNLEKVIHAFITSRLDYCSSLYIRLMRHFYPFYALAPKCCL